MSERKLDINHNGCIIKNRQKYDTSYNIEMEKTEHLVKRDRGLKP